MRKLLISLLAIGSTSAFAMSNNLFQEFDNQASIGFGMNQSQSTFGFNSALPVHNDIITHTNFLNLEAERLLNNGIWVDVNANMTFGAGPVGLSPYLNPSDYGINGKLGYAFTMAGNQHLQITPYVLGGLNNAVGTDGFIPTANRQVANEFAYRLGAGGRVEWRINRAVLLYADQLVAYNWDQSGPLFGIMPQNNMLYTSTLGAKFNVVKNFQIGLKAFYDNYQPQATNFGVPAPGSGGAPFFAQPIHNMGGLVSVGLTY